MKTLLTRLLFSGLLTAALAGGVLAQNFSDRVPSDEVTTSNYAPVVPAAELFSSPPPSVSSESSPCRTCDEGCTSMFCEQARYLPLWTATADALFLNRSKPDARVLAFNTNNPAENLNASDFNFGVHTGFDLAMQRRLGCDSAVELRYFGVDHWRSVFSSPTTPNSLTQINAAVPIFTFSGTAVDANYASALHNAEINGRKQINENWTLLAGFRYTELNEHLSASLVNSAIPLNYDATVRNRLYGFQMGGQARLISRENFSLDAFGKAGVFGNAAAQVSTLSTGIVTPVANGRGSRTSFIGETGATGTLQLTDHLAVRGGYRLLWLDGVALASEQLAVSDFAAGTGFNSSGNVFYHGAFSGLEWIY